jgi:hypothetical protein
MATPQPKGSAHVRGLSAHPRFWRSFQLHQIQPVTGCSCTKHVPFRYRFDEEPLVIVAGTASRVSVFATARHFTNLLGQKGETTFVLLCLLAKQAVGFSLARGRREQRDLFLAA